MMGLLRCPWRMGVRRDCFVECALADIVQLFLHLRRFKVLLDRLLTLSVLNHFPFSRIFVSYIRRLED